MLWKLKRLFETTTKNRAFSYPLKAKLRNFYIESQKKLNLLVYETKLSKI